jgi:hypothetical protein
MAIIYPSSQQNAQNQIITSSAPYAIEVLTSASLPIQVTGSTNQEFLLNFYIPPNTLYNTGNKKFYIAVIGTCTGSSPTVTASLKFNAGGTYNAQLTPRDPFQSGFVSQTYTRFISSSQYLQVDLGQLTEDDGGVTLPMYISGTSAFTASIQKIYLSPV